MSINVNEDVIGSGGLGGGFGLGGGYGGVILIAIILVIITMGFWGGTRGHTDLDYTRSRIYEDSSADKLTWSRYANFEDPAIAKIQTDIVAATGQIKTQNAVDTGSIIHALDQQTCEIKLGEAAIIQNALNIAREQEVMALNGRIADLRDSNLELKGRILQQETVNTIQNGNCMINHRLDQIECGMVKQPPFFAAGGSPYINPFNFQPVAAPFRDNCCG